MRHGRWAGGGAKYVPSSAYFMASSPNRGYRELTMIKVLYLGSPEFSFGTQIDVGPLFDTVVPLFDF